MRTSKSKELVENYRDEYPPNGDTAAIYLIAEILAEISECLVEIVNKSSSK